MIRCATATSKSRSATRYSLIRKERGSMASFAERTALHGLALPGRHGVSVGTAGVTIEERSDISFASVIARRGKRDKLAAAVETAYGVALPQGPRRVTRGLVTFAGIGP